MEVQLDVDLSEVRLVTETYQQVLARFAAQFRLDHPDQTQVVAEFLRRTAEEANIPVAMFKAPLDSLESEALLGGWFVGNG